MPYQHVEVKPANMMYHHSWVSCAVEPRPVTPNTLANTSVCSLVVSTQQTQNPSPLIPLVPVLDGNTVIFPAWQSCLEDVLAIQGVLDSVEGKVPCPKADPDSKQPVLTEKGYNPEEFRTDWDTLLDIACSTIKLTLLVDPSICYCDTKLAHKLFDTICEAYEKNTQAGCSRLQDLFWHAKHDPNALIAKWIAKIRNTATNLASIKITPNNQQLCNCLLQGLNESWKTIHDHLVYSPTNVSLDNAIGALEAHEVLTQVSDENFDPSAMASAAKTQKKLGCWNCGQKGHHSTKCPNPSIKKRTGAQANSTNARAGAVSFATIGNYSKNEDDDNSYDDDKCDVVWG
ncbi:hypothetical protein PCASD_09877 [Puccinia coronata f. sp. avenae]|uniref:CCHC-type domain-containing protein n=1 Tax=Puccinia coronata f. sp. avenae TaxID=200324 RepID=A0A2N5UM48_9BASI|nr:hypothetical protein PCASD_09877 [Puccinia coronata f. sp. avenae]